MSHWDAQFLSIEFVFVDRAKLHKVTIYNVCYWIWSSFIVLLYKSNITLYQYRVCRIFRTTLARVAFCLNHKYVVYILFILDNNRVMLILDIPVNKCNVSKSPHPIILFCLFIVLKNVLFRLFTVHIINHHWLSCCCFLLFSVCAGLLQTPVLAKHGSLAAECTKKNSNYCCPFHTHTLFCHRF